MCSVFLQLWLVFLLFSQCFTFHNCHLPPPWRRLKPPAHLSASHRTHQLLFKPPGSSTRLSADNPALHHGNWSQGTRLLQPSRTRLYREEPLPAFDCRLDARPTRVKTQPVNLLLASVVQNQPGKCSSTYILLHDKKMMIFNTTWVWPVLEFQI